MPYEPEGASATYQDFVKNVLPYPNGNLHPRFFGWVQGNGTPVAMLADMLASALNPHLAAWELFYCLTHFSNILLDDGSDLS